MIGYLTTYYNSIPSHTCRSLTRYSSKTVATGSHIYIAIPIYVPDSLRFKSSLLLTLNICSSNFGLLKENKHLLFKVEKDITKLIPFNLHKVRHQLFKKYLQIDSSLSLKSDVLLG